VLLGRSAKPGGTRLLAATLQHPWTLLAYSWPSWRSSWAGYLGLLGSWHLLLAVRWALPKL
jgi:hypothetical protein